MAVRPIDGEALWDKLEDALWYDNCDRDMAEKIVLDMPTLTPPNEPLTLDYLREHQKDHHATWYDIGASGAHCSRCHYRAPQQSRYCPHCGAKMERREKP